MLKTAILTFFISMIPVIELRGAIPFARGAGAIAEWLNLTGLEPLEVWQSVPIAIVGNLVPIPFLIIYGGKILRYFATFEKFGKPFRKIIEVGERKASKIEKGLFWGILIFVAIPLPGTGAWTGALIAITLQLKLKKAFPAIAVGVLIAGTIVTIVTYFDRIVGFFSNLF